MAFGSVNGEIQFVVVARPYRFFWMKGGMGRKNIAQILTDSHQENWLLSVQGKLNACLSEPNSWAQWAANE